MQWEHTTAPVGSHDENAMGLQGWELVAVDAGIAFYKRALAALGLSGTEPPASPPADAPPQPPDDAPTAVAMPTGDDAPAEVASEPVAEPADAPVPEAADQSAPAEEPQPAA